MRKDCLHSTQAAPEILLFLYKHCQATTCRPQRNMDGVVIRSVNVFGLDWFPIAHRIFVRLAFQFGATRITIPVVLRRIKQPIHTHTHTINQLIFLQVAPEICCPPHYTSGIEDMSTAKCFSSRFQNQIKMHRTLNDYFSFLRFVRKALYYRRSNFR